MVLDTIKNRIELQEGKGSLHEISSRFVMHYIHESESSDS